MATAFSPGRFFASKIDGTPVLAQSYVDASHAGYVTMTLDGACEYLEPHQIVLAGKVAPGTLPADLHPQSTRLGAIMVALGRAECR